MGKKLTLEEKINKRVMKLHQPPTLGYWFYHLVFKYFIIPKYGTKVKIIDDIKKCDGPAFLVFNHLSRIDHGFVNLACYPRKFNMVAGANEFYRSHLAWPFAVQQIIPKKNFSQDFTSFRGIKRIIDQGGVVAFAPEGTSSLFGHNQPVVAGTGHMFKHYGIPVYFLNIKGAYCVQHKCDNNERVGPIECELKLLFSKEDLKKMSGDELNAKLDEAFKHDDYEYAQKNHFKYNSKGKICNHLDDFLYKCPKCGTEFEIDAYDDVVECKHCGNGGHMNDYYEWLPFNDECKLFESPSKWLDWERSCVIKEIRADENYFYEEKVRLGNLDKYKTIKKKKLTNPCGEGTIRLDHDGFHFKGFKEGKDFEIYLDWATLYTVAIETDLTSFQLYYKGDMYEFTPLERKSVGKIILIVEEMHRLHFNTWKNFPWCEEMYK